MNPTHYELSVAGVRRSLPIIRLTPKLSIASFVILGDAELVHAAARELAPRLPQADYLVTAEAKGIPLVYALSTLLGMPRYIVARKSIKPYMQNPLADTVESITTQASQLLCLDGADAARIRGKTIIIVDDVISTGQSLATVRRLVESAGATVIAQAAILAEGDAAQREDIIYLAYLPLFPD